MPFSNHQRYTLYKKLGRHGRSAAIEGRGAMPPVRTKRTMNQHHYRSLMPMQNVPDVPAGVAASNAEHSASKIGGKKAGSPMDPMRKAHANAGGHQQSTHNQPRYSADLLNSLRGAARGTKSPGESV